MLMVLCCAIIWKWFTQIKAPAFYFLATYFTSSWVSLLPLDNPPLYTYCLFTLFLYLCGSTQPGADWMWGDSITNTSYKYTFVVQYGNCGKNPPKNCLKHTTAHRCCHVRKKDSAGNVHMLKHLLTFTALHKRNNIRHFQEEHDLTVQGWIQTDASQW